MMSISDLQIQGASRQRGIQSSSHTKEAYAHLLEKADSIIITKTRYKKPIEGTDLVIELDVFSGGYEGLMLAEVEFSSIEDA